MRRGAIVTVGALAVVALAWLIGGWIDGAGDDRTSARLIVDGRAVVIGAGGDRTEVDDHATVVHGDRIEMVAGTAVLDLAGPTDLELRGSVVADEASVVDFEEVPDLVQGDLLVDTEQPVEVVAAGTTVRLDSGAARVSRFLGMAVTAYQGPATIDSAGRVRTVAALREIEVGVLGSPPSRTPPIDYDPSDAWDRRFLAEAIDLGERIERLAVGLVQNLPASQAVDVRFLRRVLPVLDAEPAFTAALLDDDRDPAERLIGASIASLGREGSLPDRWSEVFAFRDEGAAWGLVALDQRVNQEPSLRAIEDAVDDVDLAFSNTSTTTATTSTTAPPDQPTTTTAPPPAPPPTPPTTEPPEDDPALDLGPVIDPIGDLLGGLLDDLLGG